MCSSSHNFPNVISTKLLVLAGFGAKLLRHDLSDNLAEVDEDEDDDEMEVDGAAVAPMDGATAAAASSTPLPPPTSSGIAMGVPGDAHALSPKGCTPPGAPPYKATSSLI